MKKEKDRLSIITLAVAKSYTNKAISALSEVVRYIGVTTTEISDGSTTNPITIDGSSVMAVSGDTVFYEGSAYTFDGTKWQETISFAEVITEIETITGEIGDLTALTTLVKSSIVAAINELNEKKANLSVVAALFDASVSYAVGDYCVKDGLFYKCTTAHTGAWDANDFQAVTVGNEIDANATDINGIKNGSTINNFAGVETALSGKVDKVDGKGLSTNDYDDTEKQKNANNATAITGIKNGTTINDFAGVETALDGVGTALATKQNVTDNSLETEAKTIVGAINENEGDIGQLKSGLTNLDNEVNGDATTYPYADVITIEDAVPANLADCSVKIEPVQDLHGYDKPWVGGAGKNKLPLVLADLKTANTDGTWSGETYTLNGVSFTILKDADGNVTGVKTGNNQTATGGNASFNIVTLSQGVTLDSGQYIGNGCPANGSTSTYYIRFTGGFEASNEIGEGTGVKTVTTSAISVYIRVTEGATVSDLVFTPMIRLSTETDATFAPYTNICPITGHTEASVQRDGVNIFGGNSTSNPQYVGNYYINGAQYNWSKSANAEHNCFDVEVFPNTQYRMVRETILSTVGQIRFLDINKEFISGVTLNANVNTITFSTPSGCKYIEFAMGKASQYGLSINYPSSDDNYYSKYLGKTYTIALGDTIYGGTVDFDSGVMTVTKKFVEYANGDGWERASNDPGAWFFKGDNSAVSSSNDIISDKFKQGAWNVENRIWLAYQQVHIHPDANIAPSGSTEEGLAEWKTWLSNNHLQVCYPLKKSAQFTVQLTPQQIQLLKGTNTLTASTWQISVTVNGVSGAIGQVQEQVNELAEEVDGITPTLVYTSPTTGTYGDKLAGVKTAFNNLSSAKKKTSYIVLGGSTKYGVTNWNDGIFSVSYYDAANSAFKFLSINLSGTGDAMMVMLSATTNGNSIESRVNVENSNTFALYA